MLQYKAHIGENGRINIPAKVRKATNLNVGDRIIIKVENQDIILTSLEANIKQAQELVKKYNINNVSLVDELLKQRKEEAENE